LIPEEKLLNPFKDGMQPVTNQQVLKMTGFSRPVNYIMVDLAIFDIPQYEPLFFDEKAKKTGLTTMHTWLGRVTSCIVF
jgi:hypothetical protein